MERQLIRGLKAEPGEAPYEKEICDDFNHILIGW